MHALNIDQAFQAPGHWSHIVERFSPSHLTIPPFHSNSGIHSSPTSVNYAIKNGYVHTMATTSQPMLSMDSDSDPSRHRSPWTAPEDEFMLMIVLNNSQLLTHDLKSKDRRKFWHLVSSQLTNRFGMTKNKRQCRDRFKLLFQKSITRNQFDAPQVPTNKLEQLLQDCFHTFHLTEASRFVLADTPPQIAGDIEPTDNDALQEKAQYETKYPSDDFVDNSQQMQLHQQQVQFEVHQLLTNLMSLQQQVNHLSSKIDMLTMMVTPPQQSPNIDRTVFEQNYPTRM